MKSKIIIFLAMLSLITYQIIEKNITFFLLFTIVFIILVIIDTIRNFE